MRAVQPVFDERFAGGPFALGDLILVMWEFQVLATEMQVKGFTERLHAHGRAFNVPTGTAFAPWTWPEDLAILRHAGLPQSKVSNRFLVVFVRSHPFTHAEFIKIQFLQLTIGAAAAAIFLDGKIDRTVP